MLKLGNILSTKEQYKLKFQSTESDFTTQFDYPLELNVNRNYEFGIKRFSVYNSMTNINSTNNNFTYIIVTKDSKSISKYITILLDHLKSNKLIIEYKNL